MENKVNPSDIRTITQLETEVEKVFLLADHGITKIVCATIIANRMSLDPVWLLLVGPSSSGKCLGRDTGVLMFNGQVKKVQDIIVGDLLMGDDSTPRKVKSITRGKEKLFKIKQTNGIDYIVNKSHVLSLKYSWSPIDYEGIKKGDIIDISLNQYLQKSKNFKYRFRGFKTRIEFPKRKVKIDPYFLGLWLGDGRKDGPTICKPDKEVFTFLKQYADRIGGLRVSVYKTKDRCVTYGIVSSKGSDNILKRLLISENLLFNKHILDIYKINNRQIRLQLLAGLLDSDGSLRNNSNFEFSNIDKKLANDVVFLARSLGFHTTITRKDCQIKSINFRGKYYNVYIGGPIHLIPTRIPRKQASRRYRRGSDLSTRILVIPQKIGDYYGFTLDGNGRFLLEDFTVTHNTEFISAISGLSFVHPISDLTPNTFASGQTRTGQETSLLLKINNGVMAFKDFTSVLSKNKDAKKEIMSQLREIYDGEYVKRTGTGKDIVWRGKAGAIAGSTEVIYRYLEELSSMGDRFVMYNIKQPDRLEVARRALNNAYNIQEKRQHLRVCFTSYINYVVENLNENDIQLPDDFKEEMLIVADFATKVRSSVMTDFKTGLVDFVPSAEMPMRVTSQLVTIASAFLAMKRADISTVKSDYNVLTEDEKKILYKIAFDSIPRTRRDALKPLAEYDGGITTAGLATLLDLPTPSVAKYLYQVNALGICKRQKQSGPQGDCWILKPEYRAILIRLEDIKTKEGQLISHEVDDEDINQSAEKSWRKEEENFEHVSDLMEIDFPK